jgi:hypothetical protein
MLIVFMMIKVRVHQGLACRQLAMDAVNVRDSCPYRRFMRMTLSGQGHPGHVRAAYADGQVCAASLIARSEFCLSCN